MVKTEVHLRLVGCVHAKLRHSPLEVPVYGAETNSEILDPDITPKFFLTKVNHPHR